PLGLAGPASTGAGAAVRKSDRVFGWQVRLALDSAGGAGDAARSAETSPGRIVPEHHHSGAFGSRSIAAGQRYQRQYGRDFRIGRERAPGLRFRDGTPIARDLPAARRNRRDAFRLARDGRTEDAVQRRPRTKW